MKNLVLATTVVGAVAILTTGDVAAAKKFHTAHRARDHYDAVGSTSPAFVNDVARYGNNGNSLSGSNSPAENAIGRTSGGGGFGH